MLLNRQRKVTFRRREVEEFLNRLEGELAPDREFDLRLVSDAAIKRSNRRFRNHNRPTDVLSFEPGDLLVSAETARRQARRLGHSVEEELKILALHGALHLLGYDHETPPERRAMAQVERRWRRRFGLPAALTERQ